MQKMKNQYGYPVIIFNFYNFHRKDNFIFIIN